MKSLLIFLSCLSLLSAQNLDDIISSALENSPSLEEIKARIVASEEKVLLSENFSNPELLILTNTIDDSEPMSQKSISIKQKLPYFGKREAQKNIALAQKNILQMTEASAKARLVYLIKSEAYGLYELENLYEIICEYEILTKQNLDLFESYTSTSDNQHMGIMSAELALSNLRIQKSLLSSKIRSSYARLSYMSASKVEVLDLLLDVDEMLPLAEVKKGMQNNFNVLIKDKEIKEREAQYKNADLQDYPDISVVAGYAYRENFDNYASFGLGLSLPIYGSEEHKTQELRGKLLASKAAREEMRLKVDAEFEIAYAQMQSAYETYHIINDQALPQIEHMFDLINSSVSAGADLFKYIDTLIQKLRLEQRSIASMADYNKAQAKIEELRGEID